MSGAVRPLTPVERQLKVHTDHSIRKAGGLDAFEVLTRVGRKTLHDYGNTGNGKHRDTFMPVDVLADLIADMRGRGEVPSLLTYLCDLAGGVFVPLPDGGAGAGEMDLSGWSKLIGGVAAEDGAAVSALLEALADDGRVSADEIHTGEILEKLTSVIALLCRLKIHCERVVQQEGAA